MCASVTERDASPLPTSLPSPRPPAPVYASATFPNAFCRYVKCLYVYNKVDMISIEDMDKLAREPNSIVVSVHMKLNLGALLVRAGPHVPGDKSQATTIRRAAYLQALRTPREFEADSVADARASQYQDVASPAVKSESHWFIESKAHWSSATFKGFLGMPLIVD